MNTRRRLVLSAIPALLIALSTAGLAQAQNASEPLKVIRIGVATGGVGSNPIRHGGTTTALAYSDGAFEEEFRKDGIEIKWVFFKGAGPAVNEALVNRQLDFAWQGDLPAIVHRANGVKTRIIAGSGVRTGLYLAVQPDSGIQKLEDLKGKRVAVFKGTNLHLAAVAALSARGIQERDLRLINLDLASARAALVNKDVDAIFDYVGAFDLRDKGLAKIVWSASADNYKFTRQTHLSVTDEFAQKHPQAVQRVVTTLVKVAHRYSNEANRADLFERWGKAEYPEQIWREDFIGQPLRVRLSPLLDPFLVSRYKEAARDAHALKLTRNVPEIDSWFDRSYLNVALKELNLETYWPVYGPDGQLAN